MIALGAGYSGHIRRALLLMVVAIAYGHHEDAAAEVRIGLVAPISGPSANYGQWMRQAAEDAVIAINRLGGIDREKVVLRIYDDECRPDRAIQTAQRLRQDNLIAVVGHCPAVASAVRGVYESAGIPLIIPNATLRDLGGPSQTVFHLGAREDRLAEAGVRLMRQENTGNRIGVVTDGSRAAAEVASELRRRGNVVFELNIGAVSGPRDIASRVAQLNADSIFVAANEPDRSVAQLRSLPPSILVYVAGLPTARVENWDRFWQMLGPQSSRVRVVAPPDPIRVQGLAAQALSSWSNRPDSERMSRAQPPAAYSAVVAAFELIYGHLNVVAKRSPQALKQLQSGRVELVKAMRDREQATILGPLRSGETGELQVPYVVHAPSREWTPAGSEPRVLAASKPPPMGALPPPRPAPAPGPPLTKGSPRPNGKPPVKPPAGRDITVRAQLTPGVYWNGWMDQGGQDKRVLAIGEAYEFAVDLSRYKYAVELSADAGVVLSAAVRKAIRQNRKQIPLVLRPVVAGSALAWGAGAQSEYRVSVDVEKLRPPSKEELTRDTAAFVDFQKGDKSLKELSNLFHAVRIRIPVVASSKGCGQVALSVWDSTGIRPLDHVVHTVPVGHKDACGVGTQATSSGGFTTLLEAVPSPASPTLLPHAALHVFDLPPNNTNHRGIAMFVDATPLEKNEAANVYAWWLETSIGTYVGSPGLLLKLIARAREKGDYSAVAREIRNKLFSTPSGDQADKALAALQRIAKDSAADPSILTRITSVQRGTIYLPLALLSVANSSVLARRIRVIHPAPEPSLSLTPQCVDPWTFVVPKILHKFEGEPLVGEDADWVAKSRRTTVEETRNYLDVPKPTPNMPPAVEPTNGEGIVLLAHHSEGHLWFDDATDRIGITELKRKFPPGSVAILSACSIASPDGDNDQWLNKINNRGVDTIFASPFPVPLEYGVLLTRRFVHAVRDARDKRQTPTVASLFRKASDEAAEALGSSVSKDIRHEFVLIGDPEIKLCP